MQKVSYLLITVLGLFIFEVANFSLYGQEGESDNVKALQEELKNKDFQIRISALKKLVAKVPNKEIRKILLNHYAGLPKKRQRFRVWESERALILQGLVKDDPAGTEKLISKVLGEELKGFLDWETGKREYEHPQKVMYALYELIPEYYLNSDIIREKVHKAVNKKGTPFTVKLPNGKTHFGIAKLPLYVRQRLAEINILFEVNNIENVNSKIDYIVNEIIPFPIRPIPHEIYKSQAKRIAYGKTEAVKKQRQAFATLLRSDEGIRAFGAELALVRLGREAVSHILELVKTGKLSKDKKDVLMRIAAEIMLNHLIEKKKYSDNDEAVLATIKDYVSKMEDKGVFDRRSRIQGFLYNIAQKKEEFSRTEQ